MELHHYKKTGFATTFEEQDFIISYLNYENPYRSLIVCYHVGMGKTYAAACLSSVYLANGFRVLYISRTLNSINNFIVEYIKVVAHNKLKNKIDRITTMTYTKFYLSSVKYKYGLIIMDEIHNIRENAKMYDTIKENMDSFTSSKLLIMSATPMIDSPDELDSIIKLTSVKDPMVLFPKYELDYGVKLNYQGKAINGEILYLSKMKGKQLENYHRVAGKDKNTFYTQLRQLSICHAEQFDPTIELDEQSSKIAAFLTTLSPHKLTVVFCFYITHGINFLAQVLEHRGYSRWPNTKHHKTFAIIDGNIDPEDTDKIITTFNSKANENGKLIQLLIGSSVMSESITLLRVTEVHMLSTFWNYGQVQQSLGRVNRYGSHDDMVDREINIYLHAAYYGDNEGKDIDMWKTAIVKRESIDTKIKFLQNKHYPVQEDTHEVPQVDNKLVFEVDDVVWDLSGCFAKNNYQISWGKFDATRAVGYDLNNNKIIYGKIPSAIKINLPRANCIWRSCVDGKLRYNKTDKRGKIINKMSFLEIKKLATSLNCDPSLEAIIQTMEDSGSYFDKQIEFVS